MGSLLDMADGSPSTRLSAHRSTPRCHAKLIVSCSLYLSGIFIVFDLSPHSRLDSTRSDHPFRRAGQCPFARRKDCDNPCLKVVMAEPTAHRATS